jgi:hypothetical protein
LCYGTWLGFRVFIDRRIFESEYINTLCSNNPSDINTEIPSPKISMKKESFCKETKVLPKFKQILWFLTDGLPYYYSKEIFSNYETHGVLYNVDLPGPKYSHAIYTSYLTGQLATNYEGNPIKGDNLLKSILRSKEFGPLTYVGPGINCILNKEWSFLAILGINNNFNKKVKRIIIEYSKQFILEKNL